MLNRGRPKKIPAERLGVLREIVADKPLATLEEAGAGPSLRVKNISDLPEDYKGQLDAGSIVR